MSVKVFFDMIRWNQYHNVRLKNIRTDDVIVEFSEEVPEKYADMEIKGFATDWEENIYILWV